MLQLARLAELTPHTMHIILLNTPPGPAHPVSCSNQHTCVRLSLACLALPPALSPSTMKISDSSLQPTRRQQWHMHGLCVLDKPALSLRCDVSTVSSLRDDCCMCTAMHGCNQVAVTSQQFACTFGQTFNVPAHIKTPGAVRNVLRLCCSSETVWQCGYNGIGVPEVGYCTPPPYDRVCLTLRGR